MSGHSTYETCPDCGEIRNAFGMEQHRIRRHGLVVAS